MTPEIIELPCPSCGSLQRIDEQSVPPSGEVACSTCGEPIRFRTAPHGVTGVVRVGGTLVPPPQRMTRGESMVRIEDWELPEPDATPVGDLICCPACGHRFDANAGRSIRPVVLVVEDTDFFLHLATETLSRRYQTIGVKTAGEARAVLATRPIDLVVLDLTLPDAEGTDVMRALPRHDIPVLIYTSRDETTLLGATWQQLVAMGARDVVHKGINIEDALIRKSEELLGATRR